MAINTSWQIQIGLLVPSTPGPTDFTSRVLSVSISQEVDVNVVGRGSASITLLNKDGALTPGGGGTYSSADWFSFAVIIKALTNTGGANDETTVFCGLVDDFDLVDDGVFSTVTIRAIDALAVAGKTPAYVISGATQAIQTYMAGNIISEDLPRLGIVGYSAFFDVDQDFGVPTTFCSSATSITATTVADAWQTFLVPTANDVFWGTRIYADYNFGLELVYYKSYRVGENTTRVTSRVTFEFDPAGSVSGTKLPFDINGFEQAFNNDDLITVAQVKGSYAGAATVTVEAPTLNTYGTRTVGYTQTMAVDASAVTTLAQRLANRYSTSRFNPRKLEVSSKQIQSYAANAAHGQWKSLLSVESGIWQLAKVTWTGSGAVSQTAECVIKGRRIDITPSETFVSLTLDNWVDNHGFILDTDKLDINRLA